MTKTYTFWLPALAMAASTLTTPLHISPDIRVVDNDREEAWDTLFAYAPLQAEIVPQETVQENTAAEQTLAGTSNTIDIWERLRTGFNFPQHVRGIFVTFRVLFNEW